MQNTTLTLKFRGLEAELLEDGRELGVDLVSRQSEVLERVAVAAAVGLAQGEFGVEALLEPGAHRQAEPVVDLLDGAAGGGDEVVVSQYERLYYEMLGR